MNSYHVDLDKKNSKRRTLQSTISTSFPSGIRIYPIRQTLREPFAQSRIKGLALRSRRISRESDFGTFEHALIGDLYERKTGYRVAEVETLGLSVESRTKHYAAESRVSRIPKITIKEIDPRNRVLEKIKTGAAKILENCFGIGNTDVEFSHAYKIRETIMDSCYIAQLYGLKGNDICNALTSVLLANECVYALDDVYDNHDENNGIDKAINKKSEISIILSNFIEENNRGDLLPPIYQMLQSVEALFKMEKIRDINSFKTKMILKHVGRRYSYFFKPSDKDYIDVGTHMRVFLAFVEDLVASKKEFRKDSELLRRYCNASRRITDIGDSLLDMRKDIKNHILSPFGSYTYYLCSKKERDERKRDVLFNTITSGVYNPDMEKILKAYAQRVTKNNMDYILGMPANSEKSKSVQERFLKLGNIVLEMTENIEKGRISYDNFYRQTASQLMIFP